MWWSWAAVRPTQPLRPQLSKLAVSLPVLLQQKDGPLISRFKDIALLAYNWKCLKPYDFADQSNRRMGKRKPLIWNRTQICQEPHCSQMEKNPRRRGRFIWNDHVIIKPSSRSPMRFFDVMRHGPWKSRATTTRVKLLHLSESKQATDYHIHLNPWTLGLSATLSVIEKTVKAKIRGRAMALVRHGTKNPFGPWIMSRLDQSRAWGSNGCTGGRQDFPDIRFKIAIHSANEANMLSFLARRLHWWLYIWIRTTKTIAERLSKQSDPRPTI